MKHTLTLTGSVAALTAAMQAFDAVDGEAGNPAPSTSTGAGTPAPMPQPSAPTPAVPMPTAPTPSTGSDDDGEEDGDPSDGSGLDSNGLPWDERIHSSSKKKGKDGTWNKRRGGPSGDELAAIEAELRGDHQQGDVTPTAPMPQPTPAPTPAPTMPMPTAPTVPPMPTHSEPVEQPAPPMPQPTPAAAPTPAPAASTGVDFPTLMQHIGPKLGDGEGQMSAQYLSEVCQKVGIAAITDLAIKPEHIDAVVAQFQADGRW